MTEKSVPATVLLVDDDPRVTSALLRALRREPHHFLAANAASEALLLMDRHKVDVLVSDEMMPEICGSQLIAIVRRRFPACIRIILSGRGSLEAAIRMINEGNVYRFLQKPCSPAELAATIRQALQQKKLQDLSRSLLKRHRKCVYQSGDTTMIRFGFSGQAGLAGGGDDTVIVEEDENLSLEDLVRELEEAVSR